MRPAWDALWQRADGSYIQAFGACFAAWQDIMAPLGATLHVVACFDDARLVGLWPLVRRRRAFWRVLNQLGPMAGEFSDVLVQDGPRAEAYVAAIWNCVQAALPADLIILPFVKTTSRLGALLARTRHAVAEAPDIAPYVAWAASENWDAYYRSLSPTNRRTWNKRRRQLQAMGDVRFEIVRTPERLPALIGWLLREKRLWSDRTEKRGAWLASDRYERFLGRLATEQGAGAGFVIYLLTLDGAPVAAKFAMEGPRHADWIISGFSASLARYSPGNVLNEFCLRHALDHRLDVEFAVGNEQNKLFLSRNTWHRTVSYRLALTRWGAVSLWLRAMQDGMRAGRAWLFGLCISFRTAFKRRQRVRPDSDQAPE